jgi:hypothetical protein
VLDARDCSPDCNRRTLGLKSSCEPPARVRQRFGCVRVGHRREQVQERADLESFLGAVPERAFGVHCVPGTPPDPGAGDVALGCQVGHDALHGAFGEADDRADVADAPGAQSRPAQASASPAPREHATAADSDGGNGLMAEVRNCEQCGAEFEPRREHARFCSALCRITWNRQHASGQPPGDTPLNWSVSAMEDTANRLRKAGTVNLPEALAVISEAVWWVTLVDATMVRYHHDAYDCGSYGTAWDTTSTPLTSSSRSSRA